MSFSATRLTCFALLAAMEQDMRSAIQDYLGDRAAEDLIPADRVTRANGRRVKDGLPETADLPGLLAYLDFGESFELLASASKELPPAFQASLKGLGPSVGRTIAIRNRVAHTRPMEIDDSSFLVDATKALAASSGGLWEELSSVLDRLNSDPSFVLGLTIDLPADPETGPQHNLPVPDFDETGFFGRQAELRRIMKAIKGAYPVVSILGDGGIGKTSIALKAAYELLEDPTQPFDAFVWVTAKATILTPNEIRRINGAIETSLGLIGTAALELSGVEAMDPIAEVLAYMENFRILLLLDNLETVLDGRLREFLLELPMGSKVIVTSRIGLGIENPVQLAPLTDDESTRLLRALARIRDVRQLVSLGQSSIESLARKMAGHPAYIRWFVAGVQAGKRPEDLLGNNELLLDYCMSNVYDYLSDDATSALRSMQVLAGAKNQAELAFLNDFTASQTQSALLELLTTNFTRMSNQMSGDTLDTGYELSEFARQYLDKHHPVAVEERTWLLNRSEELRDLGIEMAAANTASPFASTSVHVRGSGDFHAAGLLRTAIAVAFSDPGAALDQCVEAQLLAPSYYEAWRVEAFVRTLSRDQGAAHAAYDRALELAPDSPVMLFHFGEFLLNDVGDPQGALDLLQRAARIEPKSPEVAAQIAWAHHCLGDEGAAVSASSSVASMRTASSFHRKAACVLAFRATQSAVAQLIVAQQFDEAVEFVEPAVELAESVDKRLVDGEAADRLVALADTARNLAELSVDYAAKQAAQFSIRIDSVLSQGGATPSKRKTGVIDALVVEKGFGFVKAADAARYFFHVSDLRDRADWEAMFEGAMCVFEPGQTSKGARAKRVRLVEAG
ncbi:NB-ARC domain-containing protein [Nocardioides sp. NPDC006303]|uniref:NB-ARC domain-containing protein n=1 Tax=Nocardioides sp. NPDC006303 TaxID=3156747 RepID=UPI0033B82214